MPKYVLMSTLTGEGAQTVHKNPERMLAVNKEIEAFGCRVEAQYALLGDIDFMSIVEAPDNETAVHLSTDLASRGTVKIRTYPAIDIAALIKRLKSPHKLGHA